MKRSPAIPDDPVVRDFVVRLLPRLRDEWATEQVILFGSRARGTAGRWSDLDVVVVSPRFEGMPFIDRWPVLFRALGSPAELEPICYTPEEFERGRREPGIAATACEEGIRLI